MIESYEEARCSFSEQPCAWVAGVFRPRAQRRPVRLVTKQRKRVRRPNRPNQLRRPSRPRRLSRPSQLRRLSPANARFANIIRTTTRRSRSTAKTSITFCRITRDQLLGRVRRPQSRIHKQKQFSEEPLWRMSQRLFLCQDRLPLI